MASLSFDVLRWLNTLELKKVPRNLRHDISSGHVVAEIISRYFRDSCSILDLSEGNLPADRKENWLYIERCLRGCTSHFQKIGMCELMPYAQDLVIYRRGHAPFSRTSMNLQPRSLHDTPRAATSLRRRAQPHEVVGTQQPVSVETFR